MKAEYYDEDGYNPEVYLIAPRQSDVQKWLREVHKIVLLIHQYDNNKKYSLKLVIIQTCKFLKNLAF